MQFDFTRHLFDAEHVNSFFPACCYLCLMQNRLELLVRFKSAGKVPDGRITMLAEDA